MVVVSVGHVGGTRGSCIVSSASDMLGISVVRGMRGFGGVCEMCMCLARAMRVGRDEWMRGLGSGFTNPVGTWGVLDMCMCLGCGGVGGVGSVGGVGRELVGGLGLEWWGGVMSV